VRDLGYRIRRTECRLRSSPGESLLPDDDLDGLGTVDVVSMDETRSTFTGLDGLVENAGFPNFTKQAVLKVRFADGMGEAKDGCFEIKWYQRATTVFTPLRRSRILPSYIGHRLLDDGFTIPNFLIFFINRHEA